MCQNHSEQVDSRKIERIKSGKSSPCIIISDLCFLLSRSQTRSLHRPETKSLLVLDPVNYSLAHNICTCSAYNMYTILYAPGRRLLRTGETVFVWLYVGTMHKRDVWTRRGYNISLNIFIFIFFFHPSRLFLPIAASRRGDFRGQLSSAVCSSAAYCCQISVRWLAALAESLPPFHPAAHHRKGLFLYLFLLSVPRPSLHARIITTERTLLSYFSVSPRADQRRSKQKKGLLLDMFFSLMFFINLVAITAERTEEEHNF